MRFRKSLPFYGRRFVALLIIVLACRDATADLNLIDHVEVRPQLGVDLVAGQKVGLKAIGFSDARPLPILQAEWLSTDPAVATVDQSGTVTAIRAGKTTVIADVGGTAGSTVITVISPPSLALSPLSAELNVADNLKLDVTNAEGAVTWTSSDARVATVDASTGFVSAVGAGRTVITARIEHPSGARTGTAEIVVTAAHSRVLSISPTHVDVVAGGAVSLIATTRDSTGKVITGEPVTWQILGDSAHITLVSMPNTTTTLAIGRRPGSVKIRGVSGANADTVFVLVWSSVETVDITPSGVLVPVGGVALLQAFTRDLIGDVAQRFVGSVTWASSNHSVASVAKVLSFGPDAAHITGIAPGTATITATVGGKVATATAIVSIGTGTTIVTRGAGNGTGTVLGLGVDCVIVGGVPSKACSVVVPRGTTVRLTAYPDKGSYFAGWTGCDGRGPVCLIQAPIEESVVATFSVGRPAFAVHTMPIDEITPTHAVLLGAIVQDGGPYNVWFEWGTNPTLSTLTSTTPSNCGVEEITCMYGYALHGLAPNTTYYYRIVGSNAGGRVLGGIESFTTPR
jgi:uncharacterized protein YjdB